MVQGINTGRDIPEDALGTDGKETTESDTLLLWKDTVITGDGHVLVCDEGELDVGTETTPDKVRRLGVSRDA